MRVSSHHGPECVRESSWAVSLSSIKRGNDEGLLVESRVEKKHSENTKQLSALRGHSVAGILTLIYLQAQQG